MKYIIVIEMEGDVEEFEDDLERRMDDYQFDVLSVHHSNKRKEVWKIVKEGTIK